MSRDMLSPSQKYVGMFLVFPPSRFGRRFVVLLSHLLLLLFGVSNAFSPNFYVYMVLKFCSGFCISGIVGNAFVIGTSGLALSLSIASYNLEDEKRNDTQRKKQAGDRKASFSNDQ